MFDHIKPLIGSLATFAKQRMGFHHPPKLFLRQDPKNSNKALGKTAYYDPQQESVTLYITARHPKDILRSLAHELVHHTQNLRGDLSPEKIGQMTKNYAQDNDHMRNMEKEAYLQGNMCFRDWEDTIEDKDKILIKLAESKFLKENKTMTTKITKEYLKETIEKILAQQISENVTVNRVTIKKARDAGHKTAKAIAKHILGMRQSDNPRPGSGKVSALATTEKAVAKQLKDMTKDSAKDSAVATKPATESVKLDIEENEIEEKKNKDTTKLYGGAGADDAGTKYEVQIPEQESAFAPSHYCIHHGGVQHEGAIHQGEAIGHNWDEELGKVTHYDMKLSDGTILEDVAAEDILVTKASLAEGSYMMVGEQDHKKHDIKKKKSKKSKAKKFAMNQKPYDKATALDRKGDDGVSKKIKMKAIAEEKVSMVDAEKALYEERFGNRNKKLFEHLVKSWTK